MWVAFAVQKLLTFFQQKISEYCILNPLKQLTKWPLTSSLSKRCFEQLAPGIFHASFAWETIFVTSDIADRDWLEIRSGRDILLYSAWQGLNILNDKIIHIAIKIQDHNFQQY